jgi:catechol 2,3-dioxygenase-like lactoylglutathione lyase family enzyme
MDFISGGIMNSLGRREFLSALPALALVPPILAQTTKPAIPVRALNYFTLSVSDMKRSIEFYQGLFGMPIQARQGSTVILRIGNGPQFIALSPAGGNAPSIVPRLGVTVENFNPDRIVSILEQHGVTKAGPDDPGLTGGAMKVKVTRRGPENGGAREGTPELFFGDPDNIILQVQDTSYAGGAGALGNVVTVEPSPKKGLLALSNMNHFTIGVSDANRSNAFYQEVFGAPVRSRQATTPAWGIGPGKMFVMFLGGGGGRGRGAAPAGAGAPAAAPVPATRGRIDHVCMNMENFKPEAVMKTLEEFGIKERQGRGGAGAMVSYITRRMPERGGGPPPEGTPELYFTDPDGLLIQLQDVKYCGGGAYLGDECLG